MFCLLFKVIYAFLHALELNFMETKTLSLLFINIFMLPRLGPGKREKNLIYSNAYYEPDIETVMLSHLCSE